jgi:hypothetical protein
MEKPYLMLSTKDTRTLLAKRILIRDNNIIFYDLVRKEDVTLLSDTISEIEPLTEEEFKRWFDALTALPKIEPIFTDKEKKFLERILVSCYHETDLALIRLDRNIGRGDTDEPQRDFLEEQKVTVNVLLGKIK